jgi:hypothetical protein
MWILIAALAAVLAVAASGVVVWRLRTVHPRPAITTIDQAGPVADRYAADTVAQIPGSPKLHETLRGTVPCDGTADHAPAGSGELNVMYDLGFAQRPDGAAVIAHLRNYWQHKGYRILNEHRGATTATISVENPVDGFRLGINEGNTGDLALNISSPCLAPGAGTPTP